MADFTAIRQGLAANLAALKSAGAVGQVSAYMLENPSPPSVMVVGVQADGIEALDFSASPSLRIVLLVEACLGAISDMGSQKALDALLAVSGPTSLSAAIEADTRLTSRLADNGTVTSAQAPAADDLSVIAYRGQSRFKLPNQTDVLLATWAVQVLA